MRVGQKPKRIMGSGIVVSETFEDSVNADASEGELRVTYL